MSRHLISIVVAALVSFAPCAWAQEELAPEVAIRSEPYIAARAQFTTNLTRRGPAPQHLDLLTPPEGVREIKFRSGDFTLRAWMNEPPRGRSPLVIFLHGGFAFGQEDWDMTAAFREAGYLVVTPMLRGENSQPGVYSLFYDEVNDVLALEAHLRRQRFVDRRRIYIAGHSSGGTLALLSAMSTRHFRAAASFSASPDQVLFTRFGMRPQQIPFDVADARELEMRSPLSFAASLRTPTRIYFGNEEPHFRLSSRRTAELAAQAGADVQTVELEGDHFSALEREIPAAIAFFRAH